MAKSVPPTADVPEASPPTNGSDDSGPPPSASPTQTAEYVASLTGELAELARKTGLETLAYLLDVARFEAVAHIDPDRTGRRAGP